MLVISYDKLLEYLQNDEIKKIKNYTVSVRDVYFVINIPDYDFHVTVFADQWDEYSNKTQIPCHLFHISGNKPQQDKPLDRDQSTSRRNLFGGENDKNPDDNTDTTPSAPPKITPVVSNQMPPSTKCSTYFWVVHDTYMISYIPKEYFKYRQSNFGFQASTRAPCLMNDIMFGIETFQELLYAIRKILQKDM